MVFIVAASSAKTLEPVARPSAAMSWLILTTLCVILAASALTFWVLVRRSTLDREWVGYTEWARRHRFRSQDCKRGLPPPFDALPAATNKPAGDGPKVRVCFSDGRTSLIQMHAELPLPVGLDSSSGSTPPSPTTARVRCNVLTRELVQQWRPTGLRPTLISSSVLDLFSLSSFPMLGTTERFVVYGADAADARALSDSAARALLPPDVGLLLYSTHLILDFSTRPFDVIEFDRMRALAEQVAAHLPIPPEDVRAARR